MEHESGFTFSDALSQFLVFFNAHLAQSYRNKLFIYAAHVKRAQVVTVQGNMDRHSLYPNDDTVSRAQVDHATLNAYPLFAKVESHLKSSLDKLMNDPNEHATMEESQTPAIAAALSMALCKINRIVTTASADVQQQSARVLVISTSSDSATQYIPLMNIIFSAQKSV
jgi:transcription initiation factor TFIIH subunit 3